MNRIGGHIIGIEVSGGLSIVSVDAGHSVKLKSIIIETPETASYLVVGNKIDLLFKETEVVIGTDYNHDISLQNRIHGVISTIDKGVLISKIVIKSLVGNIESIISTNAVNQLGLKKQMTVVAMIKLNEVMLSQ